MAYRIIMTFFGAVIIKHKLLDWSTLVFLQERCGSFSAELRGGIYSDRIARGSMLEPGYI